MSEEQAQQFLQQLQMLETYVGEMTQRESQLMGIMREASAAIDSIKGIGGQEKSDTLVPLGLGTFVKTRIASKDKFILNIGAGVAIEKDKDGAINYLESRLKEIEVALQDTSAKRHDAEARLEQGKQQINQMMMTPPPEPKK